ncbi:MAG TPA: N-acetyltransferase [Thermopetrobacter sp.]|nr:N-acetyltransferase [Thermopetrobacter sp.]
MSDPTIRPVENKRDLKAFIRLPHAVFADDPAWVPPLDVERRMHLSVRHNPFFDHGEAQLFLAERDGRPVGRISAHLNHLHLRRHEDATGFFGFLDAIDDVRVFRALLEAAGNWLRAKGMARARGPFSFSINEESGLLVDGFDTPPVVMMNHARPWYDAHVRACGYAKAMDLYAYLYDQLTEAPESMLRMLRRLKDKGRLKVRFAVRKNLAAELDVLRDIFNDSWRDNWGFVPFTEAEMKQLGDIMRWIMVEEDVVIAEIDGRPAAMAVVMPDINRWIGDFNGRLLPFNWLKLIRRAKFAGPPHTVRLALMGVRRQYQKSAIGAALTVAIIDTIRDHHSKRGVKRAELSWVLESNKPMRRIIEAVQAAPYKTYRVYEKTL